MRFPAVMLIAALALSVFAPVAVSFPDLENDSAVNDCPILVTLDVCKAGAPFVSASGTAPCLTEPMSATVQPPVISRFHPAPGAIIRSFFISTLFRPPEA